MRCILTKIHNRLAKIYGLTKCSFIAQENIFEIICFRWSRFADEKVVICKKKVTDRRCLSTYTDTMNLSCKLMMFDKNRYALDTQNIQVRRERETLSKPFCQSYWTDVIAIKKDLVLDRSNTHHNLGYPTITKHHLLHNNTKVRPVNTIKCFGYIKLWRYLKICFIFMLLTKSCAFFFSSAAGNCCTKV